MNLTVLLDVAIGMALVYLGASLFVTIVNEYLAQLFKLRAKQLKADLGRLIEDPTVITRLKNNPAFKPFFEAGTVGGSYVDPKLLARQLIGGLRTAAATHATMADLIKSIDSMSPSSLKQQLLSLSQVAEQKVDAFVDDVSNWIDKSLTMMGDTYKRKMQIISLVVGLVIAGAFNLDTLGLVHHLYHDREARDALAVVATDFVQNVSAETLDRCGRLTPQQIAADTACAGVRGLLDGIRRRNESLGTLPIGWPPKPLGGFPVWITVPVGWLLTGLAVSLGASFWFDLLTRVVNIRHGMRKPGEKPTT